MGLTYTATCLVISYIIFNVVAVEDSMGTSGSEIEVTLDPRSSNAGDLDPGPVPITAEIYLGADIDGDLTLLSKDGAQEIVIDGHMLRRNNTFHNVILVCTAPFPIQWIYEGDGAPTRMYSSEIRTIGAFGNESSYEYFSTLVLMPERHNEHFTGIYSCHSTDNPEQQIFYQLYFPGRFGFATIRNRVIRIAENQTHLNIPCMMTNPKMSMALYKTFPKEEPTNLSNKNVMTFDPRKGYVLDLSKIPNPYGTYYCQIEEQPSFWKVDVVPPKDEEVRVEPNETLVKQENFSNTTLKCSSKEAVMLTFPNSHVIGIVEYGYNESKEFPFYGLVRMDPQVAVFSTLHKFLKINCITQQSKRVLHSWQLSNIGEEELSIKYLPTGPRILCCTKSGLSPIYDFVKCETKTDCRLKRSCFTNGRCEYPFPPGYVDAPPGCTAVEFEDRVPTHVAKCTVGDKSRIIPITENINRNDILMDEVEEIPPTEAILKLTVIKSEKLEVKFKCSGSLYYFALNFVFGIERINGSMEYADPGSIEMWESHEPMLRIVDMDKSIRTIICFAPISFSSDWRNVSMSVSVSETSKSRSSQSSSSMTKSRTELGRRRSRHMMA